MVRRKEKWLSNIHYYCSNGQRTKWTDNHVEMAEGAGHPVTKHRTPASGPVSGCEGLSWHHRQLRRLCGERPHPRSGPK